MPFFSITTPCWNSAKTIERTLKSILIQEFKDYEYIVVDGGSSDDTINILKKYEPFFEGRMKWKSEPDRGLYDAFNKGISLSSGTYCWNVNSDDYIEKDALEKIANFVLSQKWEKLPIISGSMNFVNTDGSLIEISRPSTFYLENGFKNDYVGVPHPATLVPREVYERHGSFDIYYKIIGDADWFHRVYAAGEKFVFIDSVLINMSDGGISNLYNYSKSLRDRIYYLNKFYSNPFVRFVRLAKWTRSFFIQRIEHANKTRQ